MPKKFLFDFDMFAPEDKDQSFPPKEDLSKYIFVNKNDEILYLNVNELFILINDDSMVKFIKDELKKWSLEENFDRIKKELLNNPDFNIHPQISQIIELFNPNPFDTTEEIINDSSMIREINDLVLGENGIYIKLLLTTLFSPVNSKKIFTKASDIEEAEKEDLKHLESGEHSSGITDVDKLVAIREIVTSLLIDTESPIHDFSKLSEQTKSIINDIIKLKKILRKYLNTPRRTYYLNPFLNATCTGVRSRWLCDTLKNTNANCNSPPEIFTEDHIKTIRETIIDVLNNLTTVTIDKDSNQMIFKEGDNYMIGGTYYKKYLKYKAKYFKLKQELKV